MHIYSNMHIYIFRYTCIYKYTRMYFKIHGLQFYIVVQPVDLYEISVALYVFTNIHIFINTYAYL